MRKCVVCERELKRWSVKYCSNKCQWQQQYNDFLENWHNGTVTGSRGISTRNISNHLRRFLLEKFGEKCSQCDWGKRHPDTNRVPLEVDHIDGNADNNSEKNLRLLCPNCHSLTSTFRNLNKGQGRSWRKSKT